MKSNGAVTCCGQGTCIETEKENGFQQTQPDLKVILFSGYSQDLAGRTLELGPGQVFLAKPFTPEQLLRLVRQVLDQG